MTKERFTILIAWTITTDGDRNLIQQSNRDMCSAKLLPALLRSECFPFLSNTTCPRCSTRRTQAPDWLRSHHDRARQETEHEWG
jgi:hypothetical protein